MAESVIGKAGYFSFWVSEFIDLAFEVVFIVDRVAVRSGNRGDVAGQVIAVLGATG